MIEQIITSSVLILAVCLIRIVFDKKIGACLKYALWLLVAVKLLVPIPHFESDISVMTAVDSITKGKVVYEFVEGDDLADADSSTMASDMTDKSAAGSFRLVDGRNVALALWVIGALALAVLFVVANLTFSSDIKKTRIYKKDYNGLDVYFTDKKISPCLYGIVNPAIYINQDMELTEEGLDYILLHEYTHYKHRDNVWALVRCICVILYWYNPLVWLAAALSARDSELACDESVVGRLGEEQGANYGKVLLEIVGFMNRENDATSRFVCSTSMSGGAREMQKRLNRLVSHPKKSKFALLMICVTSVLLIGCTFAKSTVEIKDYYELADENVQSDIQVEKREADELLSDKGIGAVIDGGMQYREVSLYEEPERDKVCIMVQPSVIRGKNNYYYIPENEEQTTLREMAAAIDEKWKPYDRRWEGKKEVGWNICYDGKTYHVFEGGYLYRTEESSSQQPLEYCEQNEELYSYVSSIMERINYTPFDVEEIKDIVSATLEVTGHRTDGELRTQTITDKKVLSQLENCFRQAQYILWGVDCCNQDACLTLTLADGTVVKMSVATDSCKNFGINGVYYDYSSAECQTAGWETDGIFSLFDEITGEK